MCLAFCPHKRLHLFPVEGYIIASLASTVEEISHTGLPSLHPMTSKPASVKTIPLCIMVKIIPRLNMKNLVGSYIWLLGNLQASLKARSKGLQGEATQIVFVYCQVSSQKCSSITYMEFFGFPAKKILLNLKCCSSSCLSLYILNMTIEGGRGKTMEFHQHHHQHSIHYHDPTQQQQHLGC